MLTIQDYIPVTKAKSSFLEIIRKIEGSDDVIAITKNGVPEDGSSEHAPVRRPHGNAGDPFR